MQTNETLKQIRPCDLDEPFVFISYSSLDAQRVWEDVLRFQQMGYNVWLDEKNLDKTKSSWRADALEAIQDINCSLMVFYVSRHSLVSQACFAELESTVEETTQATHNGPVKFVAVDAEPIDDIIQFQQLIYSEVRSSRELSKEEKTSRLITLRKCINQFFDSNNEKVRVKAYSLPNRKMDYYEEIVAAFPDDTRIPQAAPAEQKEPLITKPVPPAKKEKPAPAKPAAKDKSAEEKPIPLTQWLRRTEDGEAAMATLMFKARDNANVVLEKNNTEVDWFFLLSDSEKENAERFIVKGRAVWDKLKFQMVLDSGRTGFCMTYYELYSSYFPLANIPLMEVAEVTRGAKKDNLRIRFRNGNIREMNFGSYAEGMRVFLQTYAETDYKQLRRVYEEEQAKEEKHLQEFGFGGEKSRLDPVKIPKEPKALANFAMAEANREIEDRRWSIKNFDTDPFSLFVPAEKMSQSQLRNAAKDYSLREAEILGAKGLLQDGQGCFHAKILTKDQLIFDEQPKTSESSFAKLLENSLKKTCIRIPLNQLTKVEKGQRYRHLLLTYKGGYQEEIGFPVDYLGIGMLLQVYVEANKK